MFAVSPEPPALDTTTQSVVVNASPLYAPESDINLFFKNDTLPDKLSPHFLFLITSPEMENSNPLLTISPILASKVGYVNGGTDTLYVYSKSLVVEWK